MGKKVIIDVQEKITTLQRYIPQLLHATVWRFATEMPERAVVPEPGKHFCMFGYLYSVQGGRVVAFSSDKSGCSGASCYLGFRPVAEDAAHSLATKEKFKASVWLGEKFYDEASPEPTKAPYIVWSMSGMVPAEAVVEVVNLWVEADSLSALVTLANYDRPHNDSVIIPFSSGCQSLWALPYKERLQSEQKCVVGCMDPAMRRHLPSHLLSFSLTPTRLAQMVDNIPGSFLEEQDWQDTVKRNMY